MNKKIKYILLILILGFVFTIAIFFQNQREKRLLNGRELVRQEAAVKEKIPLIVNTAYGNREIAFYISGKQSNQKKDIQKPVQGESNYLDRLEEEMKQLDKDQGKQNTVILPVSFEGQEITWEEVKKKDAVWMLLLTIVGSILTGYLFDKEKEKNRKKRDQYLERIYPDFVEKLRLLLIAGMTTRNAIFEIVRIYQKERRRSPGMILLLNQLYILCNQYENGIPEEHIYRTWGSACDNQVYRKLSFLLSVHLKQGNARILEALQEEAEQLNQKRRDRIKKMGEELSTKLLLPMMLMLLLVMFLIMLPAYFGFY